MFDTESAYQDGAQNPDAIDGPADERESRPLRIAPDSYHEGEDVILRRRHEVICLAVELGHHPRQFRRWADGQGAPSETVLLAARIWALRTAQRLLKATGEDDLAYDVGRVIARATAPSIARGAEIHRANLAAAAEKAA